MGVCIYIYIYIYSHLQTDCFVVSQLFSVARHIGRSKLGSKPAQLYVRLSIRPLGQHAYVCVVYICACICVPACAYICMHREA